MKLSNIGARRWYFVVCGLGAIAVANGPVHAAVTDFYGQEVQVSEFLDAVTTAQETVMVGDNVELEDFGQSAGGLFNFDIDIGASTIDIDSLEAFPSGPSLPFGFVFSDVSGTFDSILSALIGSSTGFTGLAQNAISVIGGNEIVVDFEGVGIEDGAALRIDVTFADPATIPLPATLPLLGGLVGFAALGRRRGSA